jgi:putative flippase GtrA
MQSAAFWQLVRYVLIGGFVTALGVAIYWTSVESFGWAPLAGNGLAWIIGVWVGYAMHSLISFRGHGERPGVAKTGGKFIAVNVFGLALNSLWVWMLVERLGGPTWWPVVPMVIVTPLATFIMHRYWTFSAV